MSISVFDIQDGNVTLENYTSETTFMLPSAQEFKQAIPSILENTHFIFVIVNRSSVPLHITTDSSIVFKPHTVTIQPGNTHQYGLSFYSDDAQHVHLVQHMPATSQDYTF